MATQTQHQINSSKLSADVEKFLAAGGKIQDEPEVLTLQQRIDIINAKGNIGPAAKTCYVRQLIENYNKVGAAG